LDSEQDGFEQISEEMKSEFESRPPREDGSGIFPSQIHEKSVKEFSASFSRMKAEEIKSEPKPEEVKKRKRNSSDQNFEEEEGEENEEVEQNQENINYALNQISNLFFMKKLKKVLLILGISMVIVTFYVGTYFLAINIFTSIADSFT